MMDGINWGIVIQLVAIAGASIGVYAAIKTDLATLHERTLNNALNLEKTDKKAEKAHERLDRHIEVSHT